MSNILIIAGLCVVLLVMVVLVFLYLEKIKSVKSGIQRNHTKIILDRSQAEESGYDLMLLDESGAKIIESKEILQIPTGAYRLTPSDDALHRIKHLTSDLFKGVASIPNKTIEVVFNQEIQKGLSEGTYTLMRTKNGEVLADAISSSTNKVAGKGRLIESGKTRQLMGGAFQLLSIAVAQSHLADIERSLQTIKNSISEVLTNQENEEKAKITGDFNYLHDIAQDMIKLQSPEELSSQKRNAIEDIIRCSHARRDRLENDLSSLTEQIKNLKDLDTFGGTGTTYNGIKELVEKVVPLLKRRELLLNLASATNFTMAYLDPKQTEFSRMKPNGERWKILIDEFKTATIASSSMLEKAFFNSKETLQTRHENIKFSLSIQHKIATEQEKEYEDLKHTLVQTLNNLIHNDGRVHLAISFDENGEVKEAAIA